MLIQFDGWIEMQMNRKHSKTGINRRHPSSENFIQVLKILWLSQSTSKSKIINMAYYGGYYGLGYGYGLGWGYGLGYGYGLGLGCGRRLWW